MMDQLTGTVTANGVPLAVSTLSFDPIIVPSDQHRVDIMTGCKIGGLPPLPAASRVVIVADGWQHTFPNVTGGVAFPGDSGWFQESVLVDSTVPEHAV